MKNLFFLLIVALAPIFLVAQAPQKMTYQAVIRDGSDALVANSLIGMQISVLQGSAFGTAVYVETHAPTTNANGLATIEIGGGTIVSGSLAGIDWSNGPYFLKTETDPAGGTAYSITGTSQLLSVPYALHAAVADSVSSGLERAYLYLRKKATIQSISSGSIEQITNYDVSSANGISVNMASGVVTFEQTGVYLITAQTSFDASSTGRKLIWLNCSSSNWPSRIACNEMSGNANRIVTTFMGTFNAGDQISIGVSQFTGVTVDCPSDTQVYDETQLNIERLF